MLSAEPEQRAGQLECCGRRSSRGWPPSTRQRQTGAQGGPLERPARGQPAADRRVCGQTAAGQGPRATARWSSRSRWKACCANGTTWPAGCAINVKTSKPPTRLNTTPPRGTPAADPDWLLTGTRLADAEEFVAKPGYRDRLEPTRDYLAASRQAENQKSGRRRRPAPSRTPPRPRTRPSRPRTPTNRRSPRRALRKRSQILRAVLAAHRHHRRGRPDRGRRRCDRIPPGHHRQTPSEDRYREAVALRLGTDAEATSPATNPGGDIEPFRQPSPPRR